MTDGNWQELWIQTQNSKHFLIKSATSQLLVKCVCPMLFAGKKPSPVTAPSARKWVAAQVGRGGTEQAELTILSKVTLEYYTLHVLLSDLLLVATLLKIRGIQNLEGKTLCSLFLLFYISSRHLQGRLVLRFVLSNVCL